MSHTGILDAALPPEPCSSGVDQMVSDWCGSTSGSVLAVSRAVERQETVRPVAYPVKTRKTER